MEIVIIVAMILIFSGVILRRATIKKVKIKIPFMSVDIDANESEKKIESKTTK